MELPTQANLNDMLRTLGQETHLNELWQAVTRYNNQRTTSDHEWLSRISLFGAGLMVGAGLAVLLAGRQEQTAEETASSPAEDLH